MSTETRIMLRELMARPDILVCAVDEGDAMEGENLSMDEALSRRWKTEERQCQRQFLQQFFEEERRFKPQFRAGGATPSEFRFSQDLAELAVKGIICDEIEIVQEAFVANLDVDWTNSTRLMVAIGGCKALIHSRPQVTSPYKSTHDLNKAFWTTIFAGQKPQSLRVNCSVSEGWYSWSLEDLLTSPTDVWSGWLPETPSMWQGEMPILTVLESDRLEIIEIAVATKKVAQIVAAGGKLVHEMRGNVVDKVDLIANEWTDIQKSNYTRQFEELAELWQTQPYDLYHRPFDLPNVIPDPYWQTRKVEDQVARQQSISARHNRWTSAVITPNAPNSQRFRRLLMEEIKKQPAMTPQGLESVELVQYALGRRFFITKSGHFGLAPPAAEKGDKVALLQGVDVPFILRKQGRGFELIGEAYVDGLMNGAVIEQWQMVLRKLPDIVLR
ncbi:hypothetical protein DE146DRAFT_761521 [Phaeosphaeria sp. MPI-PUGE-AT-0046c]|nr:hypothetical protein DE146DRAFT_761521 [Phaeosphaeria sp. MPI-PUGE-AT-0046c]